jgi:dihydrofolate reductase
MTRINVFIVTDANDGMAMQPEQPWLKSDAYVAAQKQLSKLLIGDGTGDVHSAVIMGKIHWELRKDEPYPGCANIILNSSISSATNLKSETPIILAKSFDAALAICEKHDYTNVWVVGGVRPYNEALNSPKLVNIVVAKLKDEYPECTNKFVPFPLRVSEDKTELVTYRIHDMGNYSDVNYLQMIKRLATVRVNESNNTRSVFSAYTDYPLFNGKTILPMCTLYQVLHKEVLGYVQKFIASWRNYGSQPHTKGCSCSDGATDAACDWSPGKDLLGELLKNIRRKTNTSFSFTDGEMMLMFYVTYFAGGTTGDGFSGTINCSVSMRQVDMVAYSYIVAALGYIVHLIAKLAGLLAENMCVSVVDLYVEDGYLGVLLPILTRVPYRYPVVELPDISSFDNKLEEIKLQNYMYHDTLAC